MEDTGDKRFPPPVLKRVGLFYGQRCASRVAARCKLLV